MQVILAFKDKKGAVLTGSSLDESAISTRDKCSKFIPDIEKSVHSGTVTIPQYGRTLTSPGVSNDSIRKLPETPLREFYTKHKLPYGYPLRRKEEFSSSYLTPQVDDETDVPFFDRLNSSWDRERHCAHLLFLKPIRPNLITKLRLLGLKTDLKIIDIVGKYYLTDTGVKIDKKVLKDKSSQAYQFLLRLQQLGKLNDSFFLPGYPSGFQAQSLGSEGAIVKVEAILEKAVVIRDCDGLREEPFTTANRLQAIPYPEELL